MTTGVVMLVLAAFLAAAVEAVEALTVVLAVGVTRGWRSSLIGAGPRPSPWPRWSPRAAQPCL